MKSPIPLPKLARPSEVNVNPRPPQMERGFPVLKLPTSGAQLEVGRQYEISPLARAAIKEIYDINCPKEVECIEKDYPATVHFIEVYDADTGKKISDNSYLQPSKRATFRAFAGHRRIFKFSLNLTLLAQEQHKYKGSHLAKEIEESLPKSTKARVKKAKSESKDSKRAAEIAAIDIATLLSL